MTVVQQSWLVWVAQPIEQKTSRTPINKAALEYIAERNSKRDRISGIPFHRLSRSLHVLRARKFPVLPIWGNRVRRKEKKLWVGGDLGVH